MRTGRGCWLCLLRCGPRTAPDRRLGGCLSREEPACFETVIVCMCSSPNDLANLKMRLFCQCFRIRIPLFGPYPR